MQPGGERTMLDVLEKEKAAVQKKGEHLKETWICSMKHKFILWNMDSYSKTLLISGFSGGGQKNPAKNISKGAFMMADMDDFSDSSDEEESFK